LTADKSEFTRIDQNFSRIDRRFERLEAAVWGLLNALVPQRSGETTTLSGDQLASSGGVWSRGSKTSHSTSSSSQHEVYVTVCGTRTKQEKDDAFKAGKKTSKYVRKLRRFPFPDKSTAEYVVNQCNSDMKKGYFCFKELSANSCFMSEAEKLVEFKSKLPTYEVLGKTSPGTREEASEKL
jgi:hypothetical protein